MSNQTGMSKINAILALRRQGWTYTRIGEELNLHRQTVAKYVREHQRAERDSEPSTSTKAPTGSTDSTSTKAPTGPKVSRSRCEPYRSTILTMLEKGLSAQRIYQDLSEDANVSYLSVRRFVRQLKEASPKPFRRMECEPGEEAQIDFGTGARIFRDGKYRKTHVLRVVLSYSRKGYCEAVYRQTTEDFLRCIENAFVHFGGVPKTLVIDNLRAAVTRADWYDPVLNPKIEHFGRFYDTVFLPTKPRTPEHKGKVEAGVKYVQDNALKGRAFESLQEQNDFLLKWETTVADTRIHGTTKKHVGELFRAEEQQHLQELRTVKWTPVFGPVP